MRERERERGRRLLRCGSRDGANTQVGGDVPLASIAASVPHR